MIDVFDISLEKRKYKKINNELHKLNKNIFISIKNKNVILTKKLKSKNTYHELFYSLFHKLIEYNIDFSKIINISGIEFNNELEHILTNKGIDNTNNDITIDINTGDIKSFTISGWSFNIIDITKEIQNKYILLINNSKFTFSKILNIGGNRYSIYKEVGILYGGSRHRDFTLKLNNLNYYYRKYCLEGILKVNELIYEKSKEIEEIKEFKDLIIKILIKKSNNYTNNISHEMISRRYNTNNIQVRVNDYNAILGMINNIDNIEEIDLGIFSNGDIISKFKNEFKYNNRINKVFKNLIYIIKILKLEKYVNRSNIKLLKEYYFKMVNINIEYYYNININNLIDLYRINKFKLINNQKYDMYLIKTIDEISNNKIFPYITNIDNIILKNIIITTCGIIKNQKEFIIFNSKSDKDGLLNFDELNYYKDSDINKDYYKAYNSVINKKFGLFDFTYGQVTDILKGLKKLDDIYKTIIKEYNNNEGGYFSYFKMFDKHTTKFISKHNINSNIQLIETYRLLDKNTDNIGYFVDNFESIKNNNINNLKNLIEIYKEIEDTFEKDLFKKYFNVDTFSEFIILLINLNNEKDQSIVLTTNQFKKITEYYKIFINNIKHNSEIIEEIIYKVTGISEEIKYLMLKEFKKSIKINKKQIMDKNNLENRIKYNNSNIILNDNKRGNRYIDNYFILEILMCNKFYDNNENIEKLYDVIRDISLKQL